MLFIFGSLSSLAQTIEDGGFDTYVLRFGGALVVLVSVCCLMCCYYGCMHGKSEKGEDWEPEESSMEDGHQITSSLAVEYDFSGHDKL